MKAVVDPQALKGAILGLPELASWPEIAALFEPRANCVRGDWQLPALAGLAVGGNGETALPGVAAVACLQISIILVDDLLDQDPRGEYHRLGEGRAANMALAFQSAAIAALSEAPVDADRRALACAALAHAALMTSRGQDLDVHNLTGEENYWRVVKAKSTPFYGSALQIGGILGGATPTVAQSLYDIGVLLGEMIQVLDDLLDAFAVPANADWLEGRNNLALLYASTANHPERQRFCALRAQAGDPDALRVAQQILLRSGAVSYCVYLLIERFQAARRMLDGMHLANPALIWQVFDQAVAPLHEWLRALGLPIPAELLQEQV